MRLERVSLDASVAARSRLPIQARRAFCGGRSAATIAARVFRRANPSGVASSSVVQHSQNPRSGRRFHARRAFGSRSTTVRVGAGAKRNSVAQPIARKSGRPARRSMRRRHIRRRDHDDALLERRADLPAQPKRQVGRIEQQQRPRRDVTLRAPAPTRSRRTEPEASQRLTQHARRCASVSASMKAGAAAATSRRRARRRWRSASAPRSPSATRAPRW